jgi:hypothetical protein
MSRVPFNLSALSQAARRGLAQGVVRPMAVVV